MGPNNSRSSRRITILIIRSRRKISFNMISRHCRRRMNNNNPNTQNYSLINHLVGNLNNHQKINRRSYFIKNQSETPTKRYNNSNYRDLKHYQKATSLIVKGKTTLVKTLQATTIINCSLYKRITYIKECKTTRVKMITDIGNSREQATIRRLNLRGKWIPKLRGA